VTSHKTAFHCIPREAVPIPATYGVITDMYLGTATISQLDGRSPFPGWVKNFLFLQRKSNLLFNVHGPISTSVQRPDGKLDRSSPSSDKGRNK
jgi:hypothetical protein